MTTKKFVNFKTVMTTPENISRQLKHLLTSRTGVSQTILVMYTPAFNYAHEIISDTEKMSGYCIGELMKNGKGVKTGKWLIISTNQQLVFMHKGMISSLTHFEIPLGNNVSIKTKYKFFSTNIKIQDGVAEWELYNVNKTDLKFFETAVNNELATIRK